MSLAARITPALPSPSEPPRPRQRRILFSLRYFHSSIPLIVFDHNRVEHDNTDLAPKGEMVLRTLAMPADTNANGDIFGGWLMSQMDIGGAIMAKEIAQGRVVTVRVDGMTFYVRSPLATWCAATPAA